MLTLTPCAGLGVPWATLKIQTRTLGRRKTPAIEPLRRRLFRAHPMARPVTRYTRRDAGFRLFGCRSVCLLGREAAPCRRGYLNCFYISQETLKRVLPDPRVAEQLAKRVRLVCSNLAWWSCAHYLIARKPQHASGRHLNPVQGQDMRMFCRPTLWRRLGVKKGQS